MHQMIQKTTHPISAKKEKKIKKTGKRLLTPTVRRSSFSSIFDFSARFANILLTHVRLGLG